MASPAQLTWLDANGGMNSADPPHKIEPNQYARGTNVAIVEGLPTTRMGARVVPMSGADGAFVAVNNVQGSRYFNPAKGQGGISFAADNSMLALACGGRKYVVMIRGRNGTSKAELKDITSGLFTNSIFHLVWWGAWENFLIAQDGASNAFIWDSSSPAVFSKGYNTVEKIQSEIPNGGTVLAYAHSRGIAVLASRYVLVGDNLNRESQDTARDLIRFTDQVYWATGQYFLPPSEMGGITAADILPLQNTQHGHGSLIVHCWDGLFSIDLNIYPRTSWSSTPMVRSALAACGAAGPYALAIRDGDQVYRSRKGVQEFRSAAASPSLSETPSEPISNLVDCWLKNDYSRWLRFCSLVQWDTARRIFCTTYPRVQGRFRWHRGFVVRNTRPDRTGEQSPAAWEGLWTLSPQAAGVVQFVRGIFDGSERMFAWTRGNDKKTRLVEFSEALREDVLEDGTRHPIRCQVISRAIDAGTWWIKREYTDGKLFLRRVMGTVRWGVWFRPAESSKWIPWAAGTVENPELNPTDEADLTEAEPRTFPIPLGSLPQVCTDANSSANQSRSIQFLIRWEGYCQIEGLRVTHGDSDVSADQLDCSCFNLTFAHAAETEYDDFEYSASDEPTWITQ